MPAPEPAQRTAPAGTSLQGTGLASNHHTGLNSRGRRRLPAGVWCCIALLAWPLATLGKTAGSAATRVYEVIYRATLNPETGNAQVSLLLTQPGPLVSSISFDMPGDRYSKIRADSPLETRGDRVTWRPGKQGGTLQYEVKIDRKRSNGEADARITESWALLKLDHLFPGATTRSLKKASGQAKLQLFAPPGWSIETPYGAGAGKTFDVEDPNRRFDQPRGWMMAGKLGIRRDTIDGRLLSVASPLGTGFRANDMLTFLRWTLPSLAAVFPGLPQRLLIVSGTEDMWRGGLSGRASLYLHPDRPLISGNRTSPPLHELGHVASDLHARDGGDWIVEGLAEYYSGQVLLRSGAISERRYKESLESLARWSAGTKCVATDRSQGKQTAATVLVLRALDKEIRARSGNAFSLDTLARNLAQAHSPVTNADFRAAASALVKGPVRALSGCP